MLIIDWLGDLKESVFFQNLIFLAPYIGGTFLFIMIISFTRKMMKLPSKKQLERIREIHKNLPKD
jgi:hypothetical protein